MVENTKQNILNYLKEIGWPIPITTDPGWERYIIKDILDEFPDTPTEILEDILDLILV